MFSSYRNHSCHYDVQYYQRVARRLNALQPNLSRLLAHAAQHNWDLPYSIAALQCFHTPERLRIRASHAIDQSLIAQLMSVDLELVTTGHHDQVLLTDKLDLALTIGQSLAPWLTAEVLYRTDLLALSSDNAAAGSAGRVLHQTLCAKGPRSQGTLQIKAHFIIADISLLIADMVLADGDLGIVSTFTTRYYTNSYRAQKCSGAAV